jgi:hypothetical protein
MTMMTISTLEGIMEVFVCEFSDNNSQTKLDDAVEFILFFPSTKAYASTCPTIPNNTKKPEQLRRIIFRTKKKNLCCVES